MSNCVINCLVTVAFLMGAGRGDAREARKVDVSDGMLNMSEGRDTRK